jgi:hypothetical protein
MTSGYLVESLIKEVYFYKLKSGVKDEYIPLEVVEVELDEDVGSVLREM